MKKIFVAMVALIALTTAFTMTALADGHISGGSVALHGSPEVTPYTIKKVDGGLGEWDYGTSIGIKGLELVKTVWSNLDHGSKIHRSSCQIDDSYSDSGWVDPRVTSRSDTWGPLDSTAYANWDVKND